MTELLSFTADAEQTPFEQILARSPELATAYREFYGLYWDRDILPARLVELVRLRIAQLNGCESELAIRDQNSGVDEATVEALKSWQSSDGSNSSERAALTYAELIPFAHHQITDDNVEEIKTHLGDDGFVALAMLATFVDANCRLRMLFNLSTRRQIRQQSRAGQVERDRLGGPRRPGCQRRAEGSPALFAGLVVALMAFRGPIWSRSFGVR